MLEVRNVIKSYDGRIVVQAVSFDVHPGEIFALLGPNGAGKTTLIRMITDITRPDSGTVMLDGKAVGSGDRPNVAYMPEERGVYKRVKLVEAVAYFGELKGMTSREAREAAISLLEQVELAGHANKQVMALSKGMQQKVQLCTALIGSPRLLILDEPFTGLDPINVQLFEKMLNERRAAGATVILSTHQMNKVEELCDRALMINRGHMVLYGSVRDIRRKHSGHAVVVTGSPIPANVPGVRRAESINGATRLMLESNVTPQAMLRTLLDRGVEIETFSMDSPPLEDIFVKVVTEGLGLDQGKSGPPTIDELHPVGGVR